MTLFSRKGLAEKALQAWAREDLAEAERAVEALFARKSSDPTALIVRAWTRFKREDFSSARDDATKAIELGEASVEWYLLAADASMKLNEPGRAVSVLHPLWEKQPLDRRVAFKLGLAAEKSKNFMLASRAYESAVYLKGAPARYWFFLARAKESLGDEPGAMLAYKAYADKSRAAKKAFLKADGGLLDYGKNIRSGAAIKPPYAYGVYRACLLAKAIGIEEISVVELGVAGGRGLLALEGHAEEVERETGIKVRVFGFDTGVGLPAPTDYRDVPHFFLEGNYRMDAPQLRARLRRAELILGDAASTFGEFLQQGNPPLGAIFFDMDFYSSTSGVLDTVGDVANEASFLPRVSAYFDDVVPKRPSEFLKDYSEFTGERLAIDEFNVKNSSAKLSTDFYFRSLRSSQPWHECMFLLHRHAHPLYGKAVAKAKADALSLLSN